MPPGWLRSSSSTGQWASSLQFTNILIYQVNLQKVKGAVEASQSVRVRSTPTEERSPRLWPLNPASTITALLSEGCNYFGDPPLHATALGKRVRLPVTSPPLFSFKMRLQGNLKLVWLEKGSLMPDACINRAEHSVTVCKAGREALPAPIPTGPPRKTREEEREHGATARNGSTLSHGF